MTPMWAHQTLAVSGVLDAFARGFRRVLLCCPTGGGKTRVGSEVAWHYLGRDEPVAWYTNRKLLVEQAVRAMREQGHAPGVRAAGWDDDPGRLFQVSSVQTDYARAVKGDEWDLQRCALAVVDEAHLMKGRMASSIVKAHADAGGVVLGMTATPLGLGGHYDHLVTAGTMSELRACGALVRADHFGCSEPDLRLIGRVPVGDDPTQEQAKKAIMVPGIFGLVVREWRRLNPGQRPALLFGPGVGESLWFAERFWAEGVPAAHIDGADVWVKGRFYRTSREARDDVLAASKAGDVKVVCNRFVLREGLDMPWLYHGILATVFGSASSYLQAGGRLLRAHPGLDHVIVQDHGGHWHRPGLGSLNVNREWRLGLTDREVCASHEAALRRPPGDPAAAPEPACCPRCRQVLRGARCPCGFEVRAGKRSRPVFEADGTLVEMEGRIYAPRPDVAIPDAAKRWERMYHRAKSKAWNATFRQAYALFAHETGVYLPRDLPLMPREECDWFRKVADVPYGKLVPRPRAEK